MQCQPYNTKPSTQKVTNQLVAPHVPLDIAINEGPSSMFFDRKNLWSMDAAHFAHQNSGFQFMLTPKKFLMANVGNEWHWMTQLDPIGPIHNYHNPIPRHPIPTFSTPGTSFLVGMTLRCPPPVSLGKSALSVGPSDLAVAKFTMLCLPSGKLTRL